MPRMTLTAARRVLVAALLTGCARASQSGVSEARAAVDATFVRYAAALGASDADGWSALWAEDGMQLPPDSPPVIGKAGIREKLRSLLGQYRFDMRIHTEEVRSAGEWAFARGLYSATLTPRAGGAPIPIDGKFLTVFLRQPDGSWKIYRDIFNSNAPPSGRLSSNT